MRTQYFKVMLYYDEETDPGTELLDAEILERWIMERLMTAVDVGLPLTVEVLPEIPGMHDGAQGAEPK